MLYVHYLVHFKKNQAEIQALINSRSKVNVMTLAYISKLGLKVWSTNMRAQKINNSTLKIFGMVLANFQINNKLRKSRFFQETFLVTNTSIEVILKILFLTLSNTDI